MTDERITDRVATVPGHAAPRVRESATGRDWALSGHGCGGDGSSGGMRRCLVREHNRRRRRGISTNRGQTAVTTEDGAPEPTCDP